MIHPDTPANRALFRAIAKSDIPRAQKALAEGADPNAAWGSGSNGHPTCSALMKAVEKTPSKNTFVLVEMLLGAGALLTTTAHDRGRIPLEEALRRGNVPAMDAFLAHCGGGDGFVRALIENPVRARALIQEMAGLALTHPPMVSVFFDLWAELRAKGLGSIQEPHSAVPWPWGSLSGLSSMPPMVLDRVSALSPIPTPTSMGRKLWSAWVVEMCRNYNFPVLLKYALNKTPAQWWLMKPEGLAPHLVEASDTLLGTVAGLSAPQALKAGIQAVSGLPGGWSRLDAPDLNHLWLSACNSTACLRVLKKHLPTPPSSTALDKALLEVLGSDYDPSKRVVTAKYLIAQGARATAQNADGNTALHLVCQWNPKALRHRLALEKVLLQQAGATWSSPLNERGQTPFDVLSAHHAQEASRRLSEKMDEALPGSSSTPSPVRGLRF